jgi:pyruvate/2-oxoglutarate dehydrogenase complex dihydrolipoamide dehydrogenase (E3) component
LEKFDVIIIGSGQAGTPLCQAFVKAGKKTALIEQKFIGGTCINVGCTPTKTMIASAEIAYLAARSQAYGVNVGKWTVDLQRVRQRKDAIVTSFRKGHEKRIGASGVSLLYGRATFSGVKILEVLTDEGDKHTLNADTIIINTGGRPRIPDINGIKDISYLDSTSIMELEVLPQHLLILGGGYIALEFGQMFRRLGSEVTIIQHSNQLLDREDEDVAHTMREILEEDGIRVFLNTKATSVSQNHQGTISIEVSTPEKKQILEGSHLLVATGRIPNSDGLNLEKTGVQTDSHGFIFVNERLETDVPGIYAAGDIKGGPAFTHISYDDFRILKTNLLDQGHLTTRDRLVPYVLFTDPQLGRIGLSETEARALGLNFRVAKIPMDYVARAIEKDRTRGFMKAIVDVNTKQILGAAVLGLEGGEIMSMLEIAMMGKLPYTVLRDAVFAHPTLAEALNTLFTSLT